MGTVTEIKTQLKETKEAIAKREIEQTYVDPVNLLILKNQMMIMDMLIMTNGYNEIIKE
jgi:hypothetical protein